ncbi:hypothetical protein N0V88_007998 [Collariella sp. IMI 366227]|nr:hypothetical protein N0V88_007998 [Collariella sp. IMI 366227]
MPPSAPFQACLRAASRPSLVPTTTTAAALTRTLTTTAPTLYKQPRVPDSDIPIPSVSAPHLEIPPYPYGPRQFYHQSNTGLYGAARIRFGNNVSEEHQIKTRRKWRPNVQHKRLWSASLGVFVRTRVTTRVLRTIDKAGGLDEYLLGHKPQRVKDLGPWGWRLRWRIMQTPVLKERLTLQRAALGLPPKTEAELQIESASQLPDGVVSAEELIAETDSMLASEAAFELETEGNLKKDEFMKEEKPRK